MRTYSNGRSLIALAVLGLSGAASFMGCGGDDGTTVTTGTGSSAVGTGGAGGEGGEGAAGGSGGSDSTSSTGSTSNTGGAGGEGGAGGAGGAGGEGGQGGSAGCVVDGTLTPPEECDDGNDVDGDGCDNDCTFTCVAGTSDALCDDGEACNGAEACSPSHTCEPGAPPANGTPCQGGICVGGACVAAACGDGLLTPPEVCDDGNKVDGDGCDSDCSLSCVAPASDCPPAPPCQKAICDANSACSVAADPAQDGAACEAGGTCKAGACVPATCGNGARDTGEQCDDGNTTNLDGCDAACKFEQDLRTNYLQMDFTTDAYCGNANQLGSAIVGAAQGQLQTSFDQSIAAGQSGMLIKVLGLDNLGGTTDPMVELGVMNGAPVMAPGYNGTSDLDWWYTVSASSIDASRNPLAKLPGSISNYLLDAGPGTITLAVNFAGSPTLLTMSSAKLQASIGAATVPLISGGGPPGHLSAEHLDPALTTFATAGSQATPGKLCGNVSAESLSKTAVPPDLRVGGQFACTLGYTASNSLLDVIVNGCTLTFLPIVIINKTQPDKADPGAPAAGGGAPYTLAANAQSVVSTCTDKNNAAVDLSACLKAAAYSSYFRFTLGRVILK